MNKGSGSFKFLTTENKFDNLDSTTEPTINWRDTWDKIIPGNFADGKDGGLSDLLFYDRTNRYAQFYTSNNDQYIRSNIRDMRPLGNHISGWRDSWDQIIPGNFKLGGANRTDLFFYDKKAKQGELWEVKNGDIVTSFGATHTWLEEWDIIVPGTFGTGDRTDLFFYNKTTRRYEFWETNSKGDLDLMGKTREMKQSWDMVIPGSFGGSGYTDLLFYSKSRKAGEFYTTDGKGNMTMLGTTLNGWRSSWELIVPFKRADRKEDSLLFYDASTNKHEVEVYDVLPNGTISAVTKVSTFKKWDKIIPLDLFFHIPGRKLGNQFLFYSKG